MTGVIGRNWIINYDRDSDRVFSRLMVYNEGGKRLNVTEEAWRGSTIKVTSMTVQSILNGH